MWSKEVVELLLLKYQEHENLYNVRDPAYLDRVKRSNSLFKISEELKQINKDISVEAVKKKIHILRTQYLKESREIASSKRSGVGVEDVYEPKLWCFDQMEFLKTHCAIRKSESNISEMNESNDSIELEDQPVDINTNPKPEPKGNKRKKNFKLDDRLATMRNLLLDRLAQKRDYDWLGNQVVYDINEIKNKKIQRDTVWKIQEILREAILQDAAAESNSSGVSQEPSFVSYSLQNQPGCSFVRPPSQLSDNSNSSYSFVPVRPSPHNSSTLHSLSSQITVSSPDILQQSLDGLLDDEDF